MEDTGELQYLCISILLLLSYVCTASGVLIWCSNTNIVVAATAEMSNELTKGASQLIDELIDEWRIDAAAPYCAVRWVLPTSFSARCAASQPTPRFARR